MSQQETLRFAVLLKTLRVSAGLTQQVLAERAGLSVRGLQDLERGQRRGPRRDTVELLAAALSLSGMERTRFVATAGMRSQSTDHPAPVDHPPLSATGALVPLIGRATELALVERLLTGATAPLGAAPVLAFAGEPGIGKTRLLQAAAQYAISHGWSVLVGGCQRRGGLEPYAPLLDALERQVHASVPAQLRAALAGCSWLVRLLPELAEVLQPVPAGFLPPEQERRLVFASVARFLANMAGPAGTLLVLDDVQWAGADALDLLSSLLRSGAPVRIVCAYRDTETHATDPLGLLLADLAQGRLVRQHTLGPLAVEEATALLDALLVDLSGREHGQVEHVLQRAGGAPFFLISYAQALHQGSMAGVPWDVAQGVRQRVALLPTTGQELLGVAAVVGRRASRALLVAVTGQPEEAVVAGLEAACRARLLQEEGDAAYTFTHDVIREVVEGELGAGRRALLHRKVAAALEDDQVGSSAVTLAYHFERAGAPDKAERYLEQAGDHAWAQHAHAAAEGHYRVVIERLDSRGRTSDAVRVREKLGEVLFQAGQYGVALEVFKQAAVTYLFAGDLDGQGRVAASMGQVHAVRGSPDEGIALLQPVLERLLRGGAGPTLAAVYFGLGQLLFATGRYAESLGASQRAAALARAADDPRMFVRAESNNANILQLMGRIADAQRIDQQVLILAEADANLSCLVPVHRDLAYMQILCGDFALGRRHIDRSLALAEQLGNPADCSFTLAMRGWLAVLTGDLRAAHADLEQSLALHSRADRSWYWTYTLIFWARISLAAGDRAAATAAVEEALVLAQGSADLQALRWASTIMAEMDIMEGRPEAARVRLVPLVDRPGMQECDVTTFLPLLAWAQVELGQVEEASTTVDQALARARPEGMRLVLVDALRVQTLVALRREQWEQAAHCLAEGLALAREMPCPSAEVRLLQAAAALHLQIEEPETAQGQPAAAVTRSLPGIRRDIERTDESSAASSRKQSPGAVSLTDAQWGQIEALLPPRRHGRGRPRSDDRQTLEAILYVQRTGCTWAELPAALGDEATAHRRWQQWRAAGLWDRIAAIAQFIPA